MDVVLRPYRSLSQTAFRLMLIVVIVANLGVGAVFLAQGAIPVAGFMGLDVLALWLAFHVNYRAARREEHVRVAKGQIYVGSYDGKGGAAHWVLNPLWARVAREGPGVLVRAGGGQMRLGAFLSPKECVQLAAALDAALWRAKRGY